MSGLSWRTAALAALAWALASLAVVMFGEALVRVGLPLHELLTEWLGIGFDASIRVVDDGGAARLSMLAVAARPLDLGADYVLRGTAWQVRMNIDAVTQHWPAALALACVVPMNSPVAKAALLAASALGAWCTQFVIVPVVLATGVQDVLASQGVPVRDPDVAVLVATDRLLQNGGGWLLTFLVLVASIAIVTRRQRFGPSILDIRHGGAPTSSAMAREGAARRMHAGSDR